MYFVPEQIVCITRNEKRMSGWEWEVFDSFINDHPWTVTHAGPLRAPIISFSIKRDDKLELILETVAPQDAQTNASAYAPGTVRINTDAVELTLSPGIKAVARGVQPFWSQLTSPGEWREKSSVHSLEAVVESAGEAKYTMEWLANVDGHFFIWPDLTDDETETIKTRTLCKNQGGLVLKSSRKSFGGNRNCVKLRVADIDIYLGVSSSTSTEKHIKPGFILYTSILPNDIRLKIRNCLSFSLGMYLVDLGYTTFNQHWDLTSLKAISAYSLYKRVFDYSPMPPGPLGSIGINDINPLSLSRAVNALYSNYDALELGRLSWMYWHAVCAPVHIAAVQFGATIEALQRAYFKNNSKRKLLGKPDWVILKAKVDSAISELAVDAETKKVLENKVGNLNELPQNVAAKRLLKTLQIELGEQEKTAWERRDDAAHGNEIKEADYIRLIRDIKLLKIRFHRMLLCMTNSSDSYYDYYTPGFPTRNLRAPVPDDVPATATGPQE